MWKNEPNSHTHTHRHIQRERTNDNDDGTWHETSRTVCATSASLLIAIIIWLYLFISNPIHLNVRGFFSYWNFSHLTATNERRLNEKRERGWKFHCLRFCSFELLSSEWYFASFSPLFVYYIFQLFTFLSSLLFSSCFILSVHSLLFFSPSSHFFISQKLIYTHT